MMPNILYWNIENFGLQKIADLAEPPDPDYGYDGDGRGALRLSLIMSVLTEVCDQHDVLLDLDFIVVVEVQKGTKNNKLSQYVNANGRDGLLELFDNLKLQLNDRQPGDNWRLVPPIVVGRRGKGEGIAVFYNSRKWYFLGPYLANGVYAIPDEYRAVNALQHRQIPPGYSIAINRGLYEDQLRGQWAYGRREGGVTFPINFPDADSRQPWLTYFGTVGGAPNTLVRLMGFHSSPASAADGVRNIANIEKMMNDQREGGAARQIDVIVGDFNVDNFNDDNFNDDGPFSRLVDGMMADNPAVPPYTALVRPPATLDPKYKGYYVTEARQLLRASIADLGEHGTIPDGNYPCYAYAKKSIDNAFVRYLGFPGPTPNPNTTIVNRVVNTPFSWPPTPPPVFDPPLPVPHPVPGVYSYLDNDDEPYSSMDQTIADLLNDDGDEDVNRLFREWDNFGRIRSTSDHMPLIFQV